MAGSYNLMSTNNTKLGISKLKYVVSLWHSLSDKQIAHRTLSTLSAAIQNNSWTSSQCPGSVVTQAIETKKKGPL